MDAASQFTPQPDAVVRPGDENVHHLQLRNALIGAKNSMESMATFLDGLGFEREARTLRSDAEIAQATLDGPAAFDELWKRRWPVGQRVAGTGRTV